MITKPISNEKLLADVEFTLNQPIASSVSLENYDGNNQNQLLIAPKKGNLKSLHKKLVRHNHEHSTKEVFKQWVQIN